MKHIQECLMKQMIIKLEKYLVLILCHAMKQEK